MVAALHYISVNGLCEKVSLQATFESIGSLGNQEVINSRSQVTKNSR